MDRRHLLAGASTTVAALLAGCTGDEPPAGLHAVTATVLYRRGTEGVDYPSGAAVRVTVENTAGERLTGTLVVELRKRTETGSDVYTGRRDITLQAVTTRAYLLSFPDVFEAAGSEDRLSATARIETGA